jgi:hypothetical protein
MKKRLEKELMVWWRKRMKATCTNCGIICNVRPCKVEQGKTKLDSFYCRVCNSHFHKTIKHPDTTPLRKIKKLAELKNEVCRCDTDDKMWYVQTRDPWSSTCSSLVLRCLRKEKEETETARIQRSCKKNKSYKYQ